MTVPDAIFKVALRSEDTEAPGGKSLAMHLASVTFTESGGNGYIDPGDRVYLTMPIRNYGTNPLNGRTESDLRGTLSTTTPGVSVEVETAAYPKLRPGATGVNTPSYQIQLSSSFVPGTEIELELQVTADGGDGRSTLLRHTLFTGTPDATPLIEEDFEGFSSGLPPCGPGVTTWCTQHLAPAGSIVPWTTNNSFCGTSGYAAYHTNADDGPAANRHARIERLFSPTVTVPADADYVTLEFDVCYNTEEDPTFKVLAYDGFFLRVLDATPGRTTRSVLVEAFADELTTGDVPHYPRHFPRSSNVNYFEDMSAWAGDSGGVQRVKMRLPGMAGSTVQLRFEYTQDNIANCNDLRPGTTCGVSLDNLIMKSVKSVAP